MIERETGCEEIAKLNYLAGILDGEGSIMIYRSQGHYSLTVAIYNSERELMNWLVSEYGGCSSESHRERNKELKHKPEYRWIIMGRNAYKLLRRLEDKMIIKTERLEVAIEFYERCNKITYKGNRPRPDWLKEREDEYYLRMRDLNKKGRNDMKREIKQATPSLREQQQLHNLCYKYSCTLD